MDAPSKMLHLPDSAIRLLGSTQVITSVYSVIKEVLENSLDAGATAIDVKLENYGLDKIEVRDNGGGITAADIPVFAKRHFTSKITSHADLEKLTTYGFRGEALASLCSVSDVAVTTKTTVDDVSLTYTLSNEGNITSTIPSHLPQGTTVCAKGLFKNLPVRKQYHNATKKKKEDLKDVENLLVSYGVILPKVRFSLRHNKEIVWQKPALDSTAAVLQSILGKGVMSQMEWARKELEDGETKLDLCTPKPGSDVSSLSRSSADRSFLCINQRPVHVKGIDKLIRQYYSNCHACDMSRRPVYYLGITLPSKDLDVNLDPNKTTVMTTNMSLLKEQLEELLLHAYGPLDQAPPWRYRDADTENDQLDSPNSSAASKSSDFLKLMKKASGQSKPLTQHGDGQESSRKDSMPTRIRQVFVPVDDEAEDCDLETSSAKPSVAGEFLGRRGRSGTSSVVSASSNVDSVATGKEVDQNGFAKSGESSTASHEDRFKDDDSVPLAVLFRNSTGENSSVLATEHTLENVPPKTRGAETEVTSAGDTGARSDIEDGKESRSDNHTSEGDTGLRSDIEDGKESRSDNHTSEGDTGARSDILEVKKSRSGDQGDAVAGPSGWSLGRGITSASGTAVQPVVLLAPSSGSTPGKRPLSPSHRVQNELAPPEKRGRKLSPVQSTLYDMINNTAVKRPQSAKDVFMKEKRSSVVEQNPDADYDEVTDILTATWDGLSGEQRVAYKEKCWNDTQRYNKEVVAAKNVPGKVKLSIKGKSKPSTSVRDMVAAASTQPSPKTPGKRRAVHQTAHTEASFSMDVLRKSLLSAQSLSSSSQVFSPEARVLASLPACRAWVCSRGAQLCVLNVHRLAETVTFQRLLNQHQLPVHHCQPVRLTAGNTGDCYAVLEKLAKSQTTADTFTHLSDGMLKANGFDVKCWKDADGELCLELVGVCGDIPTYGAPDLVEVMQLLRDRTATSLAESRPLKVVNYLKGEAVRIVRKQSGERSQEDVQDLLEEGAGFLPAGCSTCFHGRPFLHTLLADVEAATASQPSQDAGPESAAHRDQECGHSGGGVGERGERGVGAAQRGEGGSGGKNGRDSSGRGSREREEGVSGKERADTEAETGTGQDSGELSEGAGGEGRHRKECHSEDLPDDALDQLLSLDDLMDFD